MDNFKNKYIAVVGVSAEPEKYGHKIFRDLLDSGYNVVGINLKGGEILGQKIYPQLKDLPIVSDLVIIVVPPAATAKIVDECHELGVKNIWMQPGTESDEVINKAKSYGMNVTARACFMKRNGIWK